MKTSSITLAAFALFAVGCTESTAPRPTASAMPSVGGPMFSAQGNGNGVVHQVSVGGADADLNAHTDANFSLVAIQHGNGDVSGQWTDQFGQGDGGVHVAVNCVFVAGNQAWISGVITSGSFGGVDFTGAPAVTRVVDNGKSANDPPDAISFTFIGVATPCTAAPNLPLLAMTDGQVTVK